MKVGRKVGSAAVSVLAMGLLSVAPSIWPVRAFDPTPALASATGFVAVTPARLLDTRDGTGGITGAVGAGGSIDLVVEGRGGLPAAGVAAVVINLTAVAPTGDSYVTAWPAGAPRPTASNLNFVTGQTVPNLVIVKVGAGGKVSLYNNAGTVDLVADVSGYYTDGSQLVPTVPARLLDTRIGQGGVTGPTSGTINVAVLGRAGVPTNATSVVLNVTATEPSGPGYLTVWPSGQPQPNASNLNYVSGQTVPNLVIVKIGAEGKISYYANTGRLNVIMDVLGFTAETTPLTDVLNAVSASPTLQARTVPAQGVLRLHSIFWSGDLCSSTNPTFAEYNLGRQWSTLATSLTFDDTLGKTNSKILFRFIGDGAVLLEQTAAFGQFVPVTVNVANVLRLRIEILNANPSDTPCSYAAALADVRLSTIPNAGLPPSPEFFPLQPSRILDTRDGTGAAKGRVPADGVVELQVLGQGGVPTNGVGAVVLNVTVTEPDSPSYLTVWPTGIARPLASNLNFGPGQSVPNLVVVSLGAAGRISLYNFAGFAHIIADVLGYFPGAVGSGPTSENLTDVLNAVSASPTLQARTVPAQGVLRLHSIFWSGDLCSSTNPTFAEYNLGRQWSTLATSLTFDDTLGKTNSKILFRFIGDGAVLLEQTAAFGQFVPVTVNVANVLRLRIEILNANPSDTPCSYAAALATPVLSR